jgi:hypothetical protein
VAGFIYHDCPMTVVQPPVVLEGLMKATTGDGEKRLGFLKITQFCFTGSPDVITLVKINLSLLGSACVYH